MDTFPPLRFYSFVIHSIDAWRLRHSYILPNIVTSTVPAINKLDLTDATFIIPICVESTDRLLNSNITLRYLDRYLKTNIIIYEIGEKPYLSDTVESLSSDLKIEYIYDPISSVFHRTRFLNSMLSKVKTAITVNYDIDVLLTPGDYRTACDAILARNSLVYPYQFGQSLVKISDKEKKRICQDLRLPDSASDGTMLERAEYGYCQFFNTQDYKDGGMENEDFVLWGREDIERYNRFQKL